MSYVCAVVVAAGEGKRFSCPRMKQLAGKAQIHKPIAKINAKPIIISCLSALDKHPLVNQIIVVVNALKAKEVITEIKKYRLKKISAIVNGGRRRQDSVYQGLKVLGPRADLVLIHDGVRPFISAALVSRVIKAAKITGAAVAAVPVKATIKEVHSPQSTVHSKGKKTKEVHSQQSKVKSKYKKIIRKTLERKNLWEAQTPQAFRRDIILRAYKKFSHLNATDDAMLVEKLGKKVSLVMGSYNNIKITTPEDLIIAQGIAKKCLTE
ncbi:MAG: IspD/TarI family cytidylyltransferase [Candidatus Omnitrophota bacterium]